MNRRTALFIDGRIPVHEVIRPDGQPVGQTIRFGPGHWTGVAYRAAHGFGGARRFASQREAVRHALTYGRPFGRDPEGLDF